jgi:hypothetical protein
MPRQCTVCIHPEKVGIDAALVRGVSPYELESTYTGLRKSALQRHRELHLSRSLLKAQEIQEIADAEYLQAELARCFERVNKLFDACDRWLTDPEDESRYDIGPRAGEIAVTYEAEDGKRRKASLSELLERVEGETGRGVVMVETKHADPRDLILKTAARLQGQLELLARLLGELQEGTTINIVNAPQWMEIRALVVSALEPHPDAKRAVVEALEGAGNG